MRPKGILKNAGGNGYTHTPQQGYPNAYGAPPSPVWSPASAERHAAFLPPQQYGQRERGGRGDRDRDREREPRGGGGERKYHSPPRDRDRERDRERERGERTKDRPKEKPREKQTSKVTEKPKSRWKENLTAASMGGAAVSLFNVLSEAAEGL